MAGSPRRQAGRPRLRGVALVSDRRCWVRCSRGSRRPLRPPAPARAPACPTASWCSRSPRPGIRQCRFNARVTRGDGSPAVRLTNITNSQTVQHTYQPGRWTASVTGSGSSRDQSVTCTFTPATLPVEVPLPDDLPAGLLRDRRTPRVCVHDRGVRDPPHAEEMKANYADGFEEEPRADRPDREGPDLPVHAGQGHQGHHQEGPQGGHQEPAQREC